VLEIFIQNSVDPKKLLFRKRVTNKNQRLY